MQSTKQKDSKLKSEGPENGGRRYKKGIFPVYDQTFQKLAHKSTILNANKRKYSLRDAGQMSHLGGAKGILAQLQGSPDAGEGQRQYYREGTDMKKALIPVAKAKVRQAYIKFKRWQKKQVQEGKALKPPEKWPDHLVRERMAAEAQLDFRRLEKTKVKERIQELKEKQDLIEKREILPEGPVGKEKDRDTSRRWIIDGQKVSFRGDVPYIDEPESRYHKMPIATYRRMVKSWRKEIVDDQPFDLIKLRRKRDEIFEKKKKEAAKAGEQPPVKKESVTNGKLDYWFQKLGIDEDDWPDWPEEAKSIDELEA